MPKRIDITGQRFGSWVVTGYIGYNGHAAEWLCTCDCGTIRTVLGSRLRTGRSKSCGCQRHKGHTLEPGEANFNCLYKGYKWNAKKRDLVFDLTKERFRLLTSSPCFYCGAEPGQEMSQKATNGPYFYSGLDRINNDKGYELDNVVPCCGVCNRMKHSMDQRAFLDHIRRIKSQIDEEPTQ